MSHEITPTEAGALIAMSAIKALHEQAPRLGIDPATERPTPDEARKLAMTLRIALSIIVAGMVAEEAEGRDVPRKDCFAIITDDIARAAFLLYYRTVGGITSESELKRVALEATAAIPMRVRECAGSPPPSTEEKASS